MKILAGAPKNSSSALRFPGGARAPLLNTCGCMLRKAEDCSVQYNNFYTWTYLQKLARLPAKLSLFGIDIGLVPPVTELPPGAEDICLPHLCLECSLYIRLQPGHQEQRSLFIALHNCASLPFRLSPVEGTGNQRAVASSPDCGLSHHLQFNLLGRDSNSEILGSLEHQYRLSIFFSSKEP